jgi:hypothetical protein
MAASEYEFITLTMPRGLSRNGVRQLLVEHAEQGRWTLDRVRIYPDGRKVVRLRRRIIRMIRTA